MSDGRDGHTHTDGERPHVTGIHHVTAIADDARSSDAFYTQVLGLRLVKRTVNHQDRFAAHRYYGDRTATPGTLLTLFVYPDLDPGRVGKPQPAAIAFAVPPDSLAYWQRRLESHDVALGERSERFGDPVLSLTDPSGITLELVATDTPPVPADSPDGPVPADHAISGLQSTTLHSASVFHTAATLEVLGFEPLDQEGDRVRYRRDGPTPAVVDLLDTDAPYGRDGIGTVHHVAFRSGETRLEAWLERLLDAGADPSYVTDRHYFRSLYVREPGGLLFELATDDPGMTVDEPVSDLGSRLVLPPGLEDERAVIEAQLPDESV
ncbi:VOC family protein [Natronobiforma cellulositropha]|uniref:VOC family protein n=1 Tax=Natronobiforma cellulositropha TaxID=1679076 RepID=UPI0021D5CBB8|nr:VOC family protein [Natronobiforma cellulositropha]